MFYTTNQSYHWKLSQSELVISGRLANQIVRIEPIRRGVTYFMSPSEQYIRWQNRHWHSVFLTDHDLLLVICLFPAILFSLSASYNHIIFYELVLSLVNFLPYFSLSYHYSTCLSSLFSISFHYFLPYFPYLFSSLLSISFHYSTYFSSVYSISFHYSTYFSSIFSKSFHY